MQAHTLLVHAACLGAGLLLGLSTNFALAEPARSRAIPEMRPSSPCTATAQQSSPQATGSPLSREDLRAILREELQVALATQQPQAEEPRPEVRSAQREPDEQQRLAYDKASQVLWTAVRLGTWTGEAREQFRGTIHELTIPQQDQLIGELFSAIQSGRLKLDGTGPPL